MASIVISATGLASSSVRVARRIRATRSRARACLGTRRLSACAGCARVSLS
jgi:hypothetical protein